MIPEQTLVEYPVFGDDSARVKPEDAKYAAGFLPGEVLPAQYHNWFLNKDSEAITRLNAGVNSMEKELVNVVTAGGGIPAQETNNQVISAIQTLIDAAKREAILAAHPVGSLYWTNSAENPRLTFGGGTWEQIKDKFILAAGDTYTAGAMGGAATVTLTEAEMPRHMHSFEPQSHHHLMRAIDYRNIKQGTGSQVEVLVDGDDAGFYTTYDLAQGFVTDAGGSQAHNNMPPYLVQYCWRRTA